MSESIPDLMHSLRNLLGDKAIVENVVRINTNCFRVTINGKEYFCKDDGRGEAARAGAESKGLQLLATASELIIPYNSRTHDLAPHGFVFTDWLEFREPTAEDWESLAHGLVEIHSQTVGRFGLDHDNFIGLTPQVNAEHEDWATFFTLNRLHMQREFAIRNAVWQDVWNSRLDRIIDQLDGFFPRIVAPALCHGDLWNGNVGFTKDGPSIFDPAVYYAHYEVDLAMARLFGGFPARFFDAYHSERSGEPGWDERKDIYNLYHLINHLNLFGTTYAPAVDRILVRYGS